MRDSTLHKLAEFICGNEERHQAYRSSLQLTVFFRKAGLPQFVHDGSKRQIWVHECLRTCTKNELKAVLKRLASPWEYDNDPEKLRLALIQLNKILSAEGVKI